ncbi:hypothetical protein H3T80_09565 [Gilliamella sp. W8145]|uniref:hypothetical protein n=1 Tax=Gilliamella sp. W8145 TaxID=2750990 RepID=UPI0018DC0CD3|nr:hypothetical protein [Gilliamella sp. W8145]MBI0104393.1 hypothetical protein [Gilliamella sp. W8145]
MKKLFFIIVILLTGCEDSENITKVKSLVYPQLDKTITIGNVLDNRSLCKTVNWQYLKDEKQRDIVEYSCNLDTKKAENFLYTQLDHELNTLKSKFVETNIKVSPEDYKKFRIDEVKASKDKRYKYTIYNNYVDINAQEFIYANAKLEAYNLLEQALDDISKSKAFIRYQQNRNYFLSNKESIKKNISGSDFNGYSISDQIIDFIYSTSHSSLVGDIFWAKTGDYPGYDNSWKYISDKTIYNKIEEMLIDIKDIHNQLKKHKIYFSNSYLVSTTMSSRINSKEIEYSDRLLKIDQDGMINLAHSNACSETFLYFLEGEIPKIVNIYDKKLETKISANNYRELLESLKATQKNIISKMISDVLLPHNNANKSNIEIVQKFQNDLKIKSYDQKIRGL